jgi:hypothetical protein
LLTPTLPLILLSPPSPPPETRPALDGVILFQYSRSAPALVNIQPDLAIDRQDVCAIQQRPHSVSCLTTEFDRKLNKMAESRLDKETIWGSLWFGECGDHAANKDDCYPFAPG